MTTRITIAILLITWTIIIVCFSAAYLTARETLLAMLDDAITVRAFAALDSHLHPRESIDTLIPPGDTYEIHDDKGSVARTFTGEKAATLRPVVTNRHFETHADGKRYRSLTVGLAPAGVRNARPGPLAITYRGPAE